MLRRFKGLAMSAFDFVVPHPEAPSAQDLQDQKDRRDAEVQRIERMTVHDGNAASVLEAARAILKDEDDRKTSTDTRAAAFLAAVATLIPLLTWAIGAATPACSPGIGCDLWAVVFIFAVFYIIAAGAWALATLSVANYHAIGTEDVWANAVNPAFSKILAKETLISALLNRDTINSKVDRFIAALRCFVRGLFLLALLLILDPVVRLHLLGGSEKTTPKEGMGPASIVVNCPSPTAVAGVEIPPAATPKPVATPKPNKPRSSPYVCDLQSQDNTGTDKLGK